MSQNTIFKLLICFLLFSNLVLSQNVVSLKIQNSFKQPMQYVSIGYLNNKYGGVSDSLGLFIVHKLYKDTLKISFIGYYPQYIYIDSQSLTKTITLIENTNNLSDVVISTKKKKNEKIRLGYYDNQETMQSAFSPFVQYALFIRNDKNIENGLITNIRFKLYELQEKKFMLRIRLLTIDTLTLLPQNDLLLSDNMYTIAQLKRRNRIDISKHKIYLPPEGVYISIEWVPQYSKARYDDRTPLMAYTSYQPELILAGNDNNTKWVLTSDPNRKLFGKHIAKSAPNISVDISY